MYVLKCSTIMCVQLGDFAELCNHLHNVILEHCNYSQEIPYAYLQTNPHFHPLTPNHHYSFSMYRSATFKHFI